MSGLLNDCGTFEAGSLYPGGKRGNSGLWPCVPTSSETPPDRVGRVWSPFAARFAGVTQVINRFPTGGHNLLLPEKVHEDAKARMVSYWVPLSPTILRVLRYSCGISPQASEEERLLNRLAADQRRSLRASTIDQRGVERFFHNGHLGTHDDRISKCTNPEWDIPRHCAAGAT